MAKSEEPLQANFTLGQLLPIRIHDYISTILFHRRHDNIEGHIDILEQWSYDVTSYMDVNEINNVDALITKARNFIDNPYKPSKTVKNELRTIERLLHRVSDRAGLKAVNVEAQQIVDTTALAADLEKYREALGR